MQWKNTSQGYGVISRLLHILMALLVVMQLVVGLVMIMLSGLNKMQWYDFHKTTGMFILGLVLLRLLWRSTNPLPTYPLGTPWWRIQMIRLMHRSFYLLLLIAPLSGWLLSTLNGYLPNIPGIGRVAFPWMPTEPVILFGRLYTWVDLSRDLHLLCAFLIVLLIVLHITAAVRHLLLKDGIVTRMFLNRT